MSNRFAADPDLFTIMQEQHDRNLDSNWRILRDTAILSGAGSLLTFMKPLRAVVLGRMLGPHAYGLFNIPLPYVQLLSIFANMGLSAAVLRAASVKIAEGREDAARAVYRRGLAAAFLSSIVWSGILSLLAPFLAGRLAGEPGASGLIILGAWMIPGLTLSALLSNMFLVYERGALLGLVRTIYTLLGLVLPVAFVIVFRQPYYVVLAFVIVEAAGAVIAFHQLHRNVITSKHPPAGSTEPVMGPLFRLAISFFFTNLGWMLINSVDRIMIQWYCATEVLGFYAIAVFFVNFLNIIPMNFSQVLTPRLTKSLTRKEAGDAWRSVQDTTRVVGILFVPVVVFTAVFAHEIIVFLFSDRFAQAAVFLRVLAFIAMLNFVCKLSWSIIVSDSNPGWRSTAYVAAGVLNIALNFTLIPRYGGTGAAAASVLSFAVLAVILQVLLKRRTGRVFPFARIVPALAASAVSVPVYFVLRDLPVPAVLLGGWIASTIIYLVVLARTGFMSRGDVEKLEARSTRVPRSFLPLFDAACGFLRFLTR